MTAPWEARYTALDITRRGKVLTVTLNDPIRRNAIGERMHAELADIFIDLATDADSHVIILTGNPSGKAFSAGGDIERMQQMIDTPALFDADVANAKKMLHALLDLDKPLIAKINGHAVGLGATLALFCDITFMADTARIGDPHVGVGLVAGDGGAIIWPQLVGLARAKEFLLTGDLLDAPRAAAIGLVNHSLPAADLDAAVEACADRLVGGATHAIRGTKATINLELKRLTDLMLDFGLAREAETIRTADHAEAVAAFAQKRAPQFGK
jgi:enoyl-CoA hydratase